MDIRNRNLFQSSQFKCFIGLKTPVKVRSGIIVGFQCEKLDMTELLRLSRRLTNLIFCHKSNFKGFYHRSAPVWITPQFWY